MASVNIGDLVYGKSEYNIFVGCFAPVDKNSYKNLSEYENIPLQYITKLSINSTLASPILKGNIVFTIPSTNPLQKIFNKLYSYFRIYIAELEPTNKAQIKGGNTNVLDHIFLVTSVNITNITSSSIEYSLSIISADWWNFINKIYISTFIPNKDNSNKDGYDTIPSIIQSAFTAANLPFDQESIPPQSVKIKYTSTINDSLSTILPYLQNKSIDNIGEDRVDDVSDDTTLLAISYNYTKNKYKLWSVSDILNKLAKASSSNTDESGISIIWYSISSNPLISGSDPDLQLLQLSNYSRLDTILALGTTGRYKLDYTTNDFNESKIESVTKSKILTNSWEVLKDTEDKYLPLNKKGAYDSSVYYPNEEFINTENTISDSDNNLLNHNKLINILLGGDKLLVKSKFDINRQVGDIVNLQISELNTTIETGANADAMNAKYNKLQASSGYYVINANEIVYEINPNTGGKMFRNYLHLTRPVNFKLV